MVDLRDYVAANGHRQFADWFDSLHAEAAAKVIVGLTRMEQGNFSNTKGVGSGVHEYKIDFGPGYRIYFGKDGNTIVILLGGGTKKRQKMDIQAAQANWADYKKRKKRETR
jgi:putative addiction module killer protein